MEFENNDMITSALISVPPQYVVTISLNMTTRSSSDPELIDAHIILPHPSHPDVSSMFSCSTHSNDKDTTYQWWKMIGR